MVNVFKAARNIYNSVSSAIHRRESDSNDEQSPLPSQDTRQKKTRPLQEETKQEQFKSNLRKKMKPTKIIKEPCSPPWQLISGTVSPQISSYTPHTLPISPTQLPFQLPISLGNIPIQTPENRLQPMTMMNQIFLPSTSSAPMYYPTGLIPSRSFSLYNYSQSSSSTSVMVPTESPKKLDQSQNTIGSSPSLSSRVRAHTVKVLTESPNKLNQPQNTTGSSSSSRVRDRTVQAPTESPKKQDQSQNTIGLPSSSSRDRTVKVLTESPKKQDQSKNTTGSSSSSRVRDRAVQAPTESSKKQDQSQNTIGSSSSSRVRVRNRTVKVPTESLKKLDQSQNTTGSSPSLSSSRDRTLKVLTELPKKLNQSQSTVGSSSSSRVRARTVQIPTLSSIAIDLSLSSRARARSSPISPTMLSRSSSPEAKKSRKSIKNKDHSKDSMTNSIATEEKVIRKSYKTPDSLGVICRKRQLHETKKFYFNFVKDGKILNAENLTNQMKKNMVKLPKNKFGFFKCICSYCEQTSYYEIGCNDVLLGHMRYRQNIKTVCVYCCEPFDFLPSAIHHVKTTHWSLGEEIPNKFMESDRKNRTL